MLLPSEFSAIRQAERLLNSRPNDPLLGSWREAFARVEQSYGAFMTMVRRPWWPWSRRSGRPIPTFAQYLHSPESGDGLVGLLSYLGTFPLKRCALWRKKLSRVALRRELDIVASQVIQLDRLSMAILAPTFQAMVASMRTRIDAQKAHDLGAETDEGALSALGALVDRGQGFARDEPDWSSQRSVEVYIDPDSVAHRLVEQVDRLETFFDASLSQPGDLAQQTIQSARVMMESGLLGLLKSYWGIERMPIQVGDRYNSDWMMPDGVIGSRSPRGPVEDRVAKVIAPGFTYNNGQVFRIAHVLISGEP